MLNKCDRVEEKDAKVIGKHTFFMASQDFTKEVTFNEFSQAAKL